MSQPYSTFFLCVCGEAGVHLCSAGVKVVHMKLLQYILLVLVMTVLQAYEFITLYFLLCLCGPATQKAEAGGSFELGI
jgi:hypothetical protein